MTVPQGTPFRYGQSVPIIAEFNEPVNLSGVEMTVNGKETLTPVESGDGVREATFLYPIKQLEDGSASLDIDITGGVDLSGHTQEAYGGTTLTFGLDELSKYYSFSTSPSANAVTDADFNKT